MREPCARRARERGAGHDSGGARDGARRAIGRSRFRTASSAAAERHRLARQPDVRIGPDCQIRNAIVDANCEIAAATRIGFDLAEDAKKYLVTEKGVVLVTPDMLAHAPP